MQTTLTPTPEQPSASETANRSAFARHVANVSPDSANLTAAEKARIRNLTVDFFEHVEEAANDTSRRQYILQTAGQICGYDQNFSTRINASLVSKAGAETGQAGRRLDYAAQMIENRFSSEVPARKFSKVRKTTSNIKNYAPIYASYNRLAEDSCRAVSNRTNRSIREFQLSALMFGVDIALVSMGGFYKPAFAGTRFVMNKGSQIGLYRLRYLCGDRCWALAWSEVHWGLRTTMIGAVQESARFAANSSLHLNETEIRSVAERQGVDPDRVVSNVSDLLNESAIRDLQNSTVVSDIRNGTAVENLTNGSTVNDLVNSSESVAGNAGEAVGDCADAIQNDPDEAAKKAEDIASGFLGGEDNQSASPCGDG